MKTLSEIRRIIADNQIANRPTYEGLTDAEIGEFNRFLMFGENNEAFPGTEEWKRITD